MSKPLEPSRYPRSYLGYADQFEAGTQEITLTFASRREQLDARLDFYGFINALKRTMPADYQNTCSVRIFASQAAPWTLRLVPADYAYTPTKVVKG